MEILERLEIQQKLLQKLLQSTNEAISEIKKAPQAGAFCVVPQEDGSKQPTSRQLENMLLDRKLPYDKPLLTLCSKAIEERGYSNFAQWLNMYCETIKTHNIRDKKKHLNTSLCNFIKG